MTVNDALTELGRGNLRCKEVTQVLESLGFTVEATNQGGHMVFVHHLLTTFTSGGYNCGHGKNPQVDKKYLKNIARILKQHKDELEQLKKEK